MTGRTLGDSGRGKGAGWGRGAPRQGRVPRDGRLGDGKGHPLFRKVRWVPRASCDGDSSERASCLIPSHSLFWSLCVPSPQNRSLHVPCVPRHPASTLPHLRVSSHLGDPRLPQGGLNADHVTCDSGALLGTSASSPTPTLGADVSPAVFSGVGTWHFPLSRERPAQRGLVSHVCASPQQIKERLPQAWKVSGGGACVVSQDAPAARWWPLCPAPLPSGLTQTREPGPSSVPSPGV